MSEKVGYCVGLLLLAMLAAEDIKERKISVDKLVLFGILGIFYQAVVTHPGFWAAFGTLVPGGFLLLLSRATKESIGYGDGAVLLALGLWTDGWFVFWVLGIGILMAGIYAVFCLVRKKKGAIPFIPFLLVGMEVVLFYG